MGQREEGGGDEGEGGRVSETVGDRQTDLRPDVPRGMQNHREILLQELQTSDFRAGDC